MTSSIQTVVGLGNPGSKYHGTWHNIGFAIVDQLAGSDRTWKSVGDLLVSSLSCPDRTVDLIKPVSYMNLSGIALAPWLQKKGRSLEHVLVVHDDVDFEQGKVRIKMGGSSGGHRGLQNIIDHLGRDYVRLRVGVGRDPQLDTATYVLKKADPSAFRSLVELGASATRTLLEVELPLAMQKLHRS